MTARPLTITATLVLATVLAGCSFAGIKPMAGNRAGQSAAAALEQAVAAPTPAGHVPKAAAVPTAPTDVVMAYAGDTRGKINALVTHYAAQYNVPESLIHRIIVRESTYNPAARNGPYFGLMQISHATARGMGYRGEPAGLLDAETNMRYAVRYLAGAYMTAGGDPDKSVQFYARGYYYDAKRLGIVEKAGLR